MHDEYVTTSVWSNIYNTRGNYKFSSFLISRCFKQKIFNFFQVFIRELISNASDSLEKLRYVQAKGDHIQQGDLPLEIHIATDDNKKTFTIQVTDCIAYKINLILPTWHNE